MQTQQNEHNLKKTVVWFQVFFLGFFPSFPLFEQEQKIKMLKFAKKDKTAKICSNDMKFEKARQAIIII